MKILPVSLTLATVTVCCAQFAVQIRSAGPLPGGPFNEKVVTGKPFTADAVLENNRTLADGNQIDNKQTISIARDSQGRTRREETLPAPPDGGQAIKTVFISDPVAHVNYVLGPGKIAHKFPFSNPGSDSGVVSISMSGPAGTEEADGQTRHFAAGQISDGVVAMEGPPLALMAKEPGESSSESLGTQNIDGVQATGTRTTITIPAEQIGNSAPLVITDERWYSQDLQALMKSVHNDPQFGESSFQLTNLQRAEPPASLFQIPSDYTVEQPPKGAPE